MKIYTSHLSATRAPVLVAEGFSVWAAIFGWLWLLLQGAWVPAILIFALSIVFGRGLLAFGGHPGGLAWPLALGVFALQGLFGRDLVRWSLALRGYAAGPVVAAADEDAAYARLCDARPDMMASLPQTAR